MKIRIKKAHSVLSILLALTLLLTVALSIPNNTAKAAGLDVSNINIVLEGDAGSGVHLNWKTARTSSSSTPQPNTAVRYCKDGESFTGTSAKQVSATYAVNDRTAYHEADIAGLEPGTTYQYQIVNTGTGLTSDTYTFTTASDTADSFTFLAVPQAHYRTTSSYVNNWGNTLNAALNKFPDAAFAVHTGDYASGTTATYWNGFFGLSAGTLPNIPLVPLPVSSGSSNGLFTLNFNLPATGNNTDNYSVLYGNALILCINSTQTSTANINTLSSWMDQQIRAHGNNKWIIASIGNSFYGISSNTSTYKKKVEALFQSKGVSLVLQGEEAYARSYLIKDGTALTDYPSQSTFGTTDGVIYLTPGSAGSEYTSVSSTAKKFLQVVPDYYANSADRKSTDKKTYSAIEVTSSAIYVNAYTASGALIDSFEINREATPPAEPRALDYTGLNNAFGNDPKTTRGFTWITNEKMESSFVEVTDTSTGAKTTYTGSISKMTGYITSKYYNKVNITGLNAGTTYEYRIGNTLTGAASGTKFTYCSEALNFTTEASDEDDFTFIHMADSQGGSSSYGSYWGNTLSTAMNNSPETAFVIHTGDMIDSRSTSHWSGFLDAFNTNLSSAAFLPVLGNHESTSSTQETFAQNVFNVSSDNGYALNYSFVYGNTLFLNINSNYTSSSHLEKQKTWILSEYAKVKDKDMFIIVSMHKAPFGGRHATDSDVVAIKNKLNPVFEQIGVDLVLNGHDHNYIRSYPIKNGSPNTAANSGLINTDNDGIVYMVSFTSGEKVYSLPSKKNYMNVLWNYNTLGNNANSRVYSKITVSQDSITVTVYTVSGFIVDQYTLVQNTDIMRSAA